MTVRMSVQIVMYLGGQASGSQTHSARTYISA